MGLVAAFSVQGTVYLLGGRNLWANIVLHGLVDSTTITLAYLGLGDR